MPSTAGIQIERYKEKTARRDMTGSVYKEKFRVVEMQTVTMYEARGGCVTSRRRKLSLAGASALSTQLNPISCSVAKQSAHKGAHALAPLRVGEGERR